MFQRRVYGSASLTKAMMTKGRLLARATLALAVLAAAVLARPALVLFAQDAPQEFVLRVPEDRIEAVAARYGLTVVRPLDEHAHGVYLVRRQTTASPALFSTSVSTDLSGASQDFLVQDRAVHLISRHARQVAAADLAAIGE